MQSQHDHARPHVQMYVQMLSTQVRSEGPSAKFCCEDCQCQMVAQTQVRLGLPEICARFCPFLRRQVPDTNCIPAYWVLWLLLDELMREDEEFGV